MRVRVRSRDVKCTVGYSRVVSVRVKCLQYRLQCIGKE